MSKIIIISFGFKYGHPECNYILDATFLKNPVYNSDWGKNSTNTPEMQEFIRAQPAFQEFIDAVIPLLEVCSKYTPVRVGIGCTGGRHRSRAVSEELQKVLLNKGHDAELHHRERIDWIK